MDSGVENVNGTVNELVSAGTIKRIRAQVDIVESNSMIEAWWRQLKHQWLYLNELDSASSVRKLIDFYVEQHNSVVPHFAFQGQTPDEMSLRSERKFRWTSKRSEPQRELQGYRTIALYRVIDAKQAKANQHLYHSNTTRAKPYAPASRTKKRVSPSAQQARWMSD